MSGEASAPRRLPWSWQTTDADRTAPAPSDGRIDGRRIALHRAIDIDAPPSVVFRWVCQLRVAPYSYDLLDNLGRRSPQTLTPGADELAVGQRFMVLRIVDFAVDDHVTSEVLPALRILFGAMTCSYVVRPRGDDGSRLVIRIEVGTAGPLRRLAATPMAWIDLLMMRKQLLNLKALAEATA